MNARLRKVRKQVGHQFEGRVFISRHVIFDELSFPFATIQSPGSTNGTSYDDMVFIPVVRTEERVTPVTPPPAAPTMAVLSPLPSSFPAPVEITHATNATTSAASSIAGDSITIPAIAVETAPDGTEFHKSFNPSLNPSYQKRENLRYMPSVG